MAIGLAEGFTEEQVRAQMDVNYLGPFRMCRAVLPRMRAQGRGLLIHVSSIAGRVLFPGCAPYCASKFALEALAEVLNYELAGTGIESAIVQPGPFPTRLLSNSPGPLDRERLSGYGGLARLREDFHKQFEEFFASDDSTDAQDAANAIVDLIGLQPGTRPLRTVGLALTMEQLRSTRRSYRFSRRRSARWEWIR
jgi:NAD(P)-dependent dehydrogenase (short-subunit alcohol dehydrogenase family)